MLTEAQIGWLAGIVDGEGNFQICNNGSHLRAKCIAITNTSPLLIERVASLIREAGMKCRVYNLSGGPSWQPQWKPAWSVEVGQIDSMKAFLKMIRPHLVEKKERCDIVLSFIEIRHSYRPRHRVRRTTTDEERLLALRIKELNQRGTSKSVETVRSPREIVKIQSELRSDAKRLAETTNPRLFN